MDANVTNIPAQAPEYCFLWIDWWATCMTKAEWSGWMQAVGSVVAILIAIAVPAWQYRTAERRDLERARDQESRDIEICAAIINRAVDDIDAARTRYATVGGDPGKQKGFARFTEPQFLGLAARMKEVPVHTLATAQNTESWLMVIHKLETVGDLIKNGPMTATFPVVLEAVYGLAISTREELTRHVAKLRQVSV